MIACRLEVMVTFNFQISAQRHYFWFKFLIAYVFQEKYYFHLKDNGYTLKINCRKWNKKTLVIPTFETGGLVDIRVAQLADVAQLAQIAS